MTDPQTFPEALNAERDARDEEPPPPSADSHTTNQSELPTAEASAEEPQRPVRSARGAELVRALQRALSRPKVRLTLLGIVLLLMAAFVVTGSAWTAPLAVAGIVVLIVAWFGSRLDGRVVLEWGRSGATFEFKADIHAPEHPTQRVESLAVARSLEPVSDDHVAIESAATTVEIDVEELKALIALAEAA